jgi:hypothetical protein
VLGYCDRGVECSQQHVRECPDFAERGACGNKRCKLPHVIRANRVRKKASSPSGAAPANFRFNIGNDGDSLDLATAPTADSGSPPGSLQQLSVENARLGDEYISLTFNESESEEQSDDDGDEEDDSGEDEQDDGEGAEKGTDPHSDDLID